MLKAKTVIALSALIPASYAAVGPWGQCGGNPWTGETTCVAGWTCVYSNPWYSQCLQAASTSAAASSTAKSSSSSSTTRASSSSSSVRTTTTSIRSTTTSSSRTSTTSTATPSGFVGRSGQKFTLNGSTFTVVGTNSYWIPQLSSSADITKAFQDIAGMGSTTVRTWGFNEVTSPSGTYYQSWSGSTATINTAGLQKFDEVVAAAKANGLRLIVALTNNWADYGGMDVYVKQILNSANHDLFYTDAQVVAAFKKYIAAFVGRYVNEPGILGWELANEPRCRGSTGTTSGSCTTTTITNWAKDISAYIKSIDKNHLVALGDEGFGLAGDGSYPYQFAEGIDFATNLAISTIDFGTFHAYPDHWGATGDFSTWGNTWITNHRTVQQSVNKPVILEEFGVLANQNTVYANWLSTVVSSGLAGDLVWQAGSQLSFGASHDDGYAVYPTEAEYQTLKSHAAALKARG